MAFTAGSASATGLYSGGTRLGVNSTIEASLTGSAILETLGGTTLDTCTSGKIKGKITNAGGSTATVSGDIEELTWGSAGTNCTKTTSTTNKGELEIHWTSGLNGTVTGKNTTVTVAAVFGDCLYGTGASLNLGTLVGSTTGNATITINTIVPRIEGSNFECPAEARWTASYAVTSPSPLHVTAS